MVKINDRCFCCVTVAILLLLHSEARKNCVKHFSQLLSCEWTAQTWPLARLFSSKIHGVLSPRFLTLLIESLRLFFIFGTPLKSINWSHTRIMLNMHQANCIWISKRRYKCEQWNQKTCWAFKPAVSESHVTLWNNLVFLIARAY